ncbi:MAG: FkbM family methyltransferase [Thaumarchaeota archaeon]|nr:FkbM family methyltransferase [Nitrososphaerota archaeon]
MKPYDSKDMLNLPIRDFAKVSIKRLLRLDRLTWMLNLASHITNWYDYYLVRLKVKENAIIRFRNGNTLPLTRSRFLKDVSNIGTMVMLQKFGKRLTLKNLSSGYQLTIDGKISFVANNLGETHSVIETFALGQYKEVRAAGKDVVDIGANIGDTAVYFSKIAHARKVIAFEPYPYSYQLAKVNLGINGIENVLLHNEGVSSRGGVMSVDPSFENVAGSDLVASKNGKEIRIVTLREIVDMFDIAGGILKVDCEGCEYELILSSNSDDLSRFDEIVIECHYGYVNIERKLVASGFNVKHTPVSYEYNPHSRQRHMYFNLVHAFNQ